MRILIVFGVQAKKNHRENPNAVTFSIFNPFLSFTGDLPYVIVVYWIVSYVLYVKQSAVCSMKNDITTEAQRGRC